jgi:hypothetical protein
MNSMPPPSSAKKRRVGDGGGGISESSSSSLPRTYFASSRCFFLVTAVAFGFAAFLFRNGSTSAAAAPGTNRINDSSSINEPILSLPRDPSTPSFRQALEPNVIAEGLWGSEAFYYCPARTTTNSNNDTTAIKKVQDIVLWHGTSFTKEQWKTSGILEQLCRVDHFSVTALDLSHRANHQALKELLNGLQEQQLLSLPIAAIVTPSASGAGIVDWINNGENITDFEQSVQLWVPVACGSVTSLDPDKMEQLKTNEFPILAIYGDRDTGGKRQSIFLGNNMGADVVEIEGGHPCYLHSPDAFVETLTKKLESLE